MVFVSRLKAIDLLAQHLHKQRAELMIPFVGILAGHVSESERERVVRRMRDDANVDGGLILSSKVGNVGVDIPRVEYLIDLGPEDMSEQQHTQRKGRAQRLAPGKERGFMITLCTDGTREHDFALDCEHTRAVQSVQLHTIPLEPAGALLCSWKDNRQELAALIRTISSDHAGREQTHNTEGGIGEEERTQHRHRRYPNAR